MNTLQESPSILDQLYQPSAFWGAIITGFLATRFLTRRRYCFEDKLVVITGGSRGLGLCLARELHRRRAKVALCARDFEFLARAKRELMPSGEVYVAACDVGERKQLEHFLDEVRTYFGRIDVLINNAGIIQVGPVELMKKEDFEETLTALDWNCVYMTLLGQRGLYNFQ